MGAKMIFVEGVDRSGKGSLIEAIHKATNYKHVIFDRGVISNYVYMMAHNRYTPSLEKEYRILEEQIAQTNHLVIHVECNVEELQRRADETQHEHIDFEYHIKLFKTIISTSPLKSVRVDTTHLSSTEIAAELIKVGLI